MIRSQFATTHGPQGAGLRATDGGSTSMSTSSATTLPPESRLAALGSLPPGYARRTRLGLDPRVRGKLERLEQQAASALAEVHRVTDLLAGERRHAQELVGTERMWHENYFHDVTTAMRDQLQADMALSEQEQQRLVSQRDAAQARWGALATVAERCRTHLNLPADGRRG